ncbi:MAG TPA: oligopeptide:H+ symporter [Rudaea sp.]|jgi:POT family proton-dependent oligopeptide transporter|nr:oligopeptide:H+ symporter [Rudaea sp.]
MTAAIQRSDELFGHPKGLYVCFFTEMWERFSFYGMKALLLLYLLKHHGFTETDAYVVVGAYGGMVYAVPLIGGMLADRYLGMRKAVVLGGILLSLGHLGMAVEGHQAATINGVVHRDVFALGVFYLSLALIISGVGFLKPNISTIVGKLYPKNDPRLDSGFTVFYAGINVGALFSSLICGYLGEVWGWGWGFGAAGVGMVAGLLMFISGQKYLHGHAEPKYPERLRRRVLGPLNVEWCIYLGAVLGLPAIWLMMQLGYAVLYLQFAFLIGWLGWFAWYISTHCNKVQREQMLAVVFFIAASLFFFAMYEQTYGSWLLFTDRMLTKDFFPSLVITDGKPWPWSIIPLAIAPAIAGIALRLDNARLARLLMAGIGIAGFVIFLRDAIVLPQTAESLEYLPSWVLIVLTPLFAWLWPFLERRRMNPSKPIKNAIGLAFTGFSFLVLSMANATVTEGHLAPVWWLLGAYVVLEIGELFLSPIGLAAVTQLSVPATVGVMMGAYWLTTSLSEQAAAMFSSFAALDIPEGGKIDLAIAKIKYGTLFDHMLWLGLGSAVIALLLSPLIKRWMHGVK